MSIQDVTQAKAQIAETAAYKTLSAFFDNGEFTEIAPLAKSKDTYAEVVAGFGFVNEEEVYAFAQNPDFCGGAMSKAQAAKLKKLYNLAYMNGSPIVGFYNSKGGRLDEGNEMLAGYGEVLSAAAKLSGVVPQISVILGTCLGTGALNAVSADFVIAVKDSKLSLDTTAAEADAETNAAKGVVSNVAENEEEAIELARDLIVHLPLNNIQPVFFREPAEPSTEGCVVHRIVDDGSIFKLGMAYGSVKTLLARVNGETVGVVRTIGKKLSADDADKIAKHVRFCDAFSIPVLTFVDSDGFEDVSSAAKVNAAYSSATTEKISVIIGKAVGSLYIALAGAGANADFVYALPEAIISPVNPEAVVLITEPELLDVPVSEQAAVVDKYAKENLSAEKAAENGYVDDIVTEGELRAVLSNALAFLENKRVTTLAKKHSTI